MATARESNFVIFMANSFDLQFNKSFSFLFIFAFFFAFILNYVYMCVTMCGYVHLNARTCQTRGPDSLGAGVRDGCERPNTGPGDRT